MKNIRSYLRTYWRVLALLGSAIIILVVVYCFRLGTLVGGLSRSELKVAQTPLGWYGIWHQPLYLPLEIVRSVIFKLDSNRGGFIVRLPNVIFGLLAVACLGSLLYVWHGVRSAILGTLLFAVSSWSLHASRLASTDVLYLIALPVLLLSNALLQKNYAKKSVVYLVIMIWGILLYTPGLVWFVLPNAFLQRKELSLSWRRLDSFWQRLLWLLSGLIWWPLLVIDFLRRASNLRLWLGAPASYGHPTHLLKEFLAVFAHLFIRGPEYPQIWLSRSPVLDIFTLTTCLIGIYFYALHYKAKRARILGYCLVVGAILIALGGPVPLSLLVPLLFLFATAGIAYLLHEWLSVFPVNPLARNIGITIVIVAVLVSCLYNIRAYFTVWPHNSATQAVFQLKD
jgi:hypothetical protein